MPPKPSLRHYPEIMHLTIMDLLARGGHALYNITGTFGITPHGAYVNEAITVNKLLNSDIVDIAENTQGYGMFVHN